MSREELFLSIKDSNENCIFFFLLNLQKIWDSNAFEIANLSRGYMVYILSCKGEMILNKSVTVLAT